MGRNLLDKVWDLHTVRELPGGQTQLFIGLHLVHEVTSPQGFQMLDDAGISVLVPQRTFATVDHIVPTDTHARPLRDGQAEEMLQAIEANTKRHGIQFFPIGSGSQGIVHVIGPELGLTQPGQTIACGDSHTSTHGAFGAIAFGIGTSQVRDVLASQCLALARPKVRRIAVSGTLGFGIFAKDVVLHEMEGGGELARIDLAGIGSLRGAHNWQNAAVAYALARSQGLAAASIAQGLKSFAGLSHRMEQVARLGKVLFVNDSKATNASAAGKALASFSDIYWIIGGRPKEGGLAGLEPLFGRIARAYLIGEAADAFARQLGDAVDHVHCGTLDRAVEAAATDASRSTAKEPVVLLSPACASYDQFANFEKRGEAFRQIVMAFDGARSVTAEQGKAA